MQPLKDLISSKSKLKSIAEPFSLKGLTAGRRRNIDKIIQFIDQYSVATISACRGYSRDGYKKYREIYNLPNSIDATLLYKESWAKQYKITKAENFRRHKELLQHLHKRLYARVGTDEYEVIPIYGCYKEAGTPKPSMEISYIVFMKDYYDLYKIICELGTLFEQDAVCVLRIGASYGHLIKTSPPDINSNPEVKLHEPISRFRGWKVQPENTSTILENFSRASNTDFWWLDMSLKSHQVIRGVRKHGLTNIEASLLSRKLCASGSSYTAPKSVITTSGTIFRDWYNLDKPNKNRTPLHEYILKEMRYDEQKYLPKRFLKEAE